MRRQVPFSAVVISLMGDGPKTIDPVMVLSCVILEDKILETQVDGIVTKVRAASSHIFSMTLQMTHHFSPKINSLKKRLERLQQIVFCDCQQLYELMPSSDGIDIKKLGQHGFITTDSCNAAQKARRLLQYQIGGSVF